MGHTDPQIMAIKITATPWNWTRLGNDQDSISQGKNSKGGYENNYVSNAHSLDTQPGAARKRTDPKHSTHKSGVGYPRRKPPLGKPDLRLGKSRWNKYPNCRETTNVHSKRWSEGQTLTKTHHHGKLLSGTQLHGNPRTRH